MVVKETVMTVDRAQLPIRPWFGQSRCFPGPSMLQFGDGFLRLSIQPFNMRSDCCGGPDVCKVFCVLYHVKVVIFSGILA